MRKWIKKLVMVAVICSMCLGSTVNIMAMDASNTVKKAPTIKLNTLYSYSSGSTDDLDIECLDERYLKFVVKQSGTYKISINSDEKLYFNEYLDIYNSEVKLIKGSNNLNGKSNVVLRVDLKKGTYYIKSFLSRGHLKIAAPSNLPQMSYSSKRMSRGDITKLSVKNVKSSVKIKWISGNPSVATVNSKGRVTAKKKGTANIFAIVNNRCVECKVVVR